MKEWELVLSSQEHLFMGNCRAPKYMILKYPHKSRILLRLPRYNLCTRCIYKNSVDNPKDSHPTSKLCGCLWIFLAVSFPV